MALTDAKAKAAKPSNKPYKMFDTGGLFLFVWPGGGKLWRFRYRLNGKEKLLAIGEYPRVSLIEARRRRDKALGQLDEGIDPGAEKRDRKSATKAAALNTFEKVARDWHANRKHEWTPKYAEQVMGRLEADLFPDLGAKPIAAIEPQDLLTTLRKAEGRGVLETTRRLKQYSSAIFRFAIASGLCKHDPAAPLRGALKAPPKPVHHKFLARAEVGEFLRRLAAYDGEADTRDAIALAMLTVVRTTELRAARQTEFEALDKPASALWRIPGERMKMDTPHLVPLSRQAAEILRRVKVRNKGAEFLFPSRAIEGFMSNNTMLYGLYRMGYHGRTTTHGFRSLFSTEANEHGFDENWIERQLAHDERNKVRAAYNAAQYLPQRRDMLQWWADRLDALEQEHLEALTQEPLPGANLRFDLV